MEQQSTLPGTDTPLSRAADEFVESFDALNKGKTRKDKAELKLLEEMKIAKISSLTHGGHTLVLRPGRTSDDKITVK
ncbi:MAG: hypothetical protein WC750_06215 [Patescibacteria group bacterium]|jgi:hypothetical protein